MKQFNHAKKEHLKRLEQFVPIVARVHGEAHPEFLDVKKVFDEINLKIKNNKEPDLTKEFENLRQITKNYTVPKDVCESYRAVYDMLSNLDKAYNNS